MTNLPSFPLISVVVATYNGEQFLCKQIDSILAQTYPNIEIVIIDDCSTDNTVNLLKQYSSVHSKIFLYTNDSNLGYIKNFERGISLTNGDLIAPCDQDDIWLPNKLQILFNQIGDNLLVYSDSTLIDAMDNSLNINMSHIKNQISYTSCLMYTIGAWAPGHSMLFKKSLIDKCLPFPSLVTHDFWLGFVATCYSNIKYVKEPLVLYRQHNHNAISAFTRNAPKIKLTRAEKLKKIRERMKLLYEKCPEENIKEKEVFKIILESYQSFSLRNNWVRMTTFLKYRDLILAYKKKSELMKILFCLKLFFKID